MAHIRQVGDALYWRDARFLRIRRIPSDSCSESALRSVRNGLQSTTTVTSIYERHAPSACHLACRRVVVLLRKCRSQARWCELMGNETPTVNRESQGPPPKWAQPHPTSPFLTIRLRHRFTTFWRVGTAIHNFGRCDSQVRGPDSHFDSQLLGGKLLEWRSLFRDRHPMVHVRLG